MLKLFGYNVFIALNKLEAVGAINPEKITEELLALKAAKGQSKIQVANPNRLGVGHCEYNSILRLTKTSQEFSHEALIRDSDLSDLTST